MHRRTSKRQRQRSGAGHTNRKHEYTVSNGNLLYFPIRLTEAVRKNLRPTARASLPGDHRELEPPDPIPNSEVKRFIANGSVRSPHARVGHRQASKPKTPLREFGGGFFFVPSNRALRLRSGSARLWPGCARLWPGCARLWSGCGRLCSSARHRWLSEVEASNPQHLFDPSLHRLNPAFKQRRIQQARRIQFITQLHLVPYIEHIELLADLAAVIECDE